MSEIQTKFKKLLTEYKRGDIISKLTPPRTDSKRFRCRQNNNFEKKQKKLLTKVEHGDIISELTARNGNKSSG